MSSILAMIIPADATDSQLAASLQALANHRAAVDGVSNVALSNAPAPAPVAQPDNDVMAFLSQPEAPALPSVEEMDASGDPLWLSQYVASNDGEMPEVDDENAWHILAALKGHKESAMPPALVTLRKSANMVRTRYAKTVKNGGSNGHDEAPSASDSPLDFLTSTASTTSTTDEAPEAPTFDVDALQVASEINDTARQVIVKWAEKLTDQPRKVGDKTFPGNKTLILAWASGDQNPVTKQPLTLDELGKLVSGDQVKTLRRHVANAYKSK